MWFELDPAKEAEHLAKHGLPFGDAIALFTNGTEYLDISDDRHSDQEDRMIAIGVIERGVIMVVFTERNDDTIRIISSRKATKEAIRLFRQHLGDAT